LSATPFPADQKSQLHLVAANFGQANYGITEKLMYQHAADLLKRFGDKWTIEVSTLRIPLPEWSSDSTMLKSGLPSSYEGAEISDYSDPDIYGSAHVQGRNALIFVYLLSFCAAKKIPLLLTGHQLDVREWDQIGSLRMRCDDSGPLFVDRMNLLSEVGFTFRTRVQAPFLDQRLSKYQIVQLGKELEVDVGRLTYSCIFDTPCVTEQCEQDIIRRKAFAVCGVVDRQKELAEAIKCDRLQDFLATE